MKRQRRREWDTQSPNHLITQSLRGLTIGFIGAGTMGRGLIKGLLAHGVPARKLYAADSNPAVRRHVQQRFRVKTTLDNLEVVCASDAIILAVKPQQMGELLTQIKSHVKPRQLVISIAAGVTLNWLQIYLHRVPVVRVMPNLPATEGCGFSAIAPGRYATSRHRAIVNALFGAVGEVCEVPERLFDAVTAMSGSGPAYVFFLVDAWEEAARRLGLPPAIAARAIRQTLQGSAGLLRASDDPAATLMQRVASKGGTTEAALKVLARRAVRAHFIEALRAAARRSRELSWN